MKKYLLFTLAILFGGVSFGQVVLPHFYDFETTPSVPAGWTTNTTSFYSSGVSGISGKLNQENQHFTVNFLDEPGDVTYWLKGWIGGSASSWEGTFTVEESDNGSTWTTLEQYVDNLNSGSYVQYTASPASTTRYIRWYFTDKQSGSNVGIDDVTIALPVAGPAQEINVTYGGNNVPSTTQVSFNSPVSTPFAVNLTVENLGTVNDLTISNATISGANAGDFSITSTPTVIGAGNDDVLSIDFTPGASGTRTATLSIANDDSNEDPYIIELYGVGGSLSSEPSAPATNLSFTDVKSYRMTVNWTASNDADGYLVVRRKGAAVSGAPADGTTYMQGDALGGGKVAYIGDATAFIPLHVVANSDYHYAVYAYNGFDQYINYLDGNPLTGMQTSSSNMMGNYYNGIDPNASTFVSDLTALINPHDFTWYGEFDETMIKLFTRRDTSNGQKVVTCVYSGEEYIYDEPFDWSVYSREHTYPHSWMPTEPADNPEQPEYNDQHHLFPTRFDDVNQTRLNYPFGEVVNVTSTYQQGTFGTDINGNNVYEPKDAHKGDAARAVFYMCAAYNGIDGNEWNLPDYIGIFVPYGQDQDVLREWHWNDLPDDWEIARNDFLDSLQGNRNPFIDSVDWVCHINFYDMTKIDNPAFPCESTPDAIAENSNLVKWNVYPNPGFGEVNVRYTLKGDDEISMRVLDLTGKVIIDKQLSGVQGEHLEILDLDLAAGIYQLELQGTRFTAAEKLVIQ